MRSSIILCFYTFLAALSNGQTVTISGFAPDYIGKNIEACAIDDYFSYYETVKGKAKVKEDSTFSITFDCSTTRQILIRSNNNRSFLYVSPGRNYTVYLPERDLYNPYRPAGNDVELTFFGLDSTDINYKILSFQRWVDYFVANTYYRREADTTNADFVKSLDKFKSEAQLYYQDDTSFFFKTYIKFTIAGLDNVQHAAERNRYEKYDFYIKGHPVSYQNDVYMQYMKGFYKNILPRLHEKINRDVYEGVLNASPTLIMHALGYEMTLQNLRVREMVMLNMLTEEFYTGDYPQTNILAILDSVSSMGMFKQHRLIAKNLKSRLIELVPGVKAPDFVLIDEGVEAKTLGSYQSKYLYVHVMNPNSDNDIRSLSLLKDLHGKYNDFVNFVTIYRRDDGVTLDSNVVAQLDELPWNVYGLKASNSIWKNYQISTFPHYVLIDLHGFIVASPALSPTPNGQYETIDKTFYLIQQAIKRSGQ